MSTSAVDAQLLAATLGATTAIAADRDSRHLQAAVLALAQHRGPKQIEGVVSREIPQPLLLVEEAMRCRRVAFTEVSPTRENAWARTAHNTHQPPRAAPKAAKLTQTRETAWGDAVDLRRSPQQNQ